MTKSKIEWTDRVWNPIVGCTKVSEGCRNCYAERSAHRMNSNPSTPQYHGITENGRWTGEVRYDAAKLDRPTRWRKPAMVFVNSMSDLFHEALNLNVVADVFRTIEVSRRHTFQILTKRSERMRYFFACHSEYWQTYQHDGARGGWGKAPGLPNLWLGVSVENQAAADERIPNLLACPAGVRWVSVEPMLGPVDLSPWLHDGHQWTCDVEQGNSSVCNCSYADVGLDWVVVGGESGPNARPMHPDWVRSVKDQCITAGVPFMFKQWGEWCPLMEAEGEIPPDIERAVISTRNRTSALYRVGKRNAGRRIDGKVHDEYPER